MRKQCGIDMKSNGLVIDTMDKSMQCVECNVILYKEDKDKYFFKCSLCNAYVCVDCWYKYFSQFTTRRNGENLLDTVEICKKCLIKGGH